MNKRVLVVGPSVPDCLAKRSSLSIVHHPLIELRPLPVDIERLRLSLSADGIIITSKHAAMFFHTALQSANLTPQAQLFFCVGGKSAQASSSLFPNRTYLIAPCETQEGIVDLIVAHRPQHLFWPHSSQSRRHLPSSLKKAGIYLSELALYTPVPTKIPCSLEGIDIVFFTSPSSVDAFFDLFTSEEILSVSFQAIGPVTEERLHSKLRVLKPSPPPSSLNPL